MFRHDPIMDDDHISRLTLLKGLLSLENAVYINPWSQLSKTIGSSGSLIVVPT